jgi:hypothetical protein
MEIDRLSILDQRIQDAGFHVIKLFNKHTGNQSIAGQLQFFQEEANVKYILGKVVSEVLDVENVSSGLALEFPFVTIGVEDTMTEQCVHAISESRTFLIVIEIGYKHKLV